MKNKATTIIKKYFFLMALVAMVGGFSAFKIKHQPQDELVWFEVTNDIIQHDQQSTTGPGGSCNLEIDDVICLAAFNESQLINGQAPTSDPHDPSVKDLAYRPEMSIK